MPQDGNEGTRERDERIERLWSSLDTRGEGQIDFKGFKKGLKKIDHRMLLSSTTTTCYVVLHHILIFPDIALKNADDLLYDILKAIDTSQDGRIQYSGALTS